MANGIVIIDKPAGWTSMDVCAKLRGILRERRVGHGGTLDPMATGVLPVFVGRAARGVEFAEKGNKEYVAGLLLGRVTNTQDTSGEVLEEHPVSDRAAGAFPGGDSADSAYVFRRQGQWEEALRIGQKRTGNRTKSQNCDHP